MYYPWNINGVKANVTKECLYINIGTYLYKKEGCKIRKGGFFEHNKYLFRKKSWSIRHISDFRVP